MKHCEEKLDEIKRKLIDLIKSSLIELETNDEKVSLLLFLFSSSCYSILEGSSDIDKIKTSKENIHRYVEDLFNIIIQNRKNLKMN